MTQLGALFVAMVSTARRKGQMRIQFTSNYDEHHLTSVVQPALGVSAGRLAHRRSTGFLSRLLAPSANPATQPSPRTFWRSRLQIRDATHWRYEELDRDNITVRECGYDGVDWWEKTDKAKVHEPPSFEDRLELPGWAWQYAVPLAMCEALDQPTQVLTVLEIREFELIATAYGEAGRLWGRPRIACRAESALVSPWGDECVVDVHQETGIVLAARNVNAAGEVLSMHTIDELAVDIELPPDIFAVPKK